MSWHTYPSGLPDDYSALIKCLDERDRLGLFDPVPLKFRDSKPIREMNWPAWDSDHELEQARREARRRRLAAIDNQCDGCWRGIPLGTNGIHKTGLWDGQFCINPEREI